MKMQFGDAVYVQSFDGSFMLRECDMIPSSVLNEIYKNGISFGKGRNEQYIFDVIFREPDNMKWVLEQDFILDFNSYYVLPFDKLTDLQRKLSSQIYDVRNSSFVSGVGISDRGIVGRRDIWAWHKFMSVSAMIEYKEGDVDFVFPTHGQKKSFFSRLFSKKSAH